MTSSAKPACPCCGSTDVHPRYHAHNRHNTDKEIYEIIHCSVCGFGFVWPLPIAATAADYFEAYWDDTRNGLLGRIIEWYKRFLVWTEAHTIIRLCGKGRVLDVGCGDGELTAILKKQGCEVEGTEVSKAGYERAVNTFGIRMHLGTIETLTRPLHGFDTVVVSSVLEHVSDPRSLLEAAHCLLRPGGCIYIVVPNSESLQAKWLKENWFAVHPPEHLLYFTETSIRRLLSTCGYRQVTTQHGMFRHSPAMFVSSLFPWLEPFRVQSENLSFTPLRMAVFLGLTYLVLPFLFIERILHRGGIIVVTAHTSSERT